MHPVEFSWFRGDPDRFLLPVRRFANSTGGSHATPLHAALVKKHLDIASLLLENGADPSSRDRGRAPLKGLSITK